MSRSASNADATTTSDDLEDNVDGSIGSNDDNRSNAAVENEIGESIFRAQRTQSSQMSQTEEEEKKTEILNFAFVLSP